ncbi:MAG: hypothetical protein Q9159_002567 [Coniocarpon cinnabarinum]
MKTRSDTASEKKAIIYEDSCCRKDGSSDTIPSSVTGDSSRPLQSSPRDVGVNNFVEDIKVNVQGMTCSSCEKKLARSLASQTGVSDVRVVFASGHADFKIDTRMNDSASVITKAQGISGFSLNRVRSESQKLDLIAPAASIQKFISIPPPGVDDIEILGPRKFRVFYDPRIIGARTLLENLGGNVQLAPLEKNDELGREKAHLITMATKTTLSIMLTIPICVLAWSNAKASESTKGIVSLILASLIQAIAVEEFYWKAFKSLFRNGSIELDMLVVISVTAAYVYSVIAFGFLMAGRPLNIKQFFETSALLVSLILLGRLLASYARAKAIASVSVRSLQETLVSLTTHDGGTQIIDARLLQHRDVFRVDPHTHIPTDGIVIKGLSDVDESMLTGESARVAKSAGSKIIAGTLNGDGMMMARVDRLPGENTISDIADVVEAAQASKPRVQALADVVAGYFIPVVVSVAIIAFVVWIPVALRVQHQSRSGAVITAISYAIAVLAVSCPCAVGLAVPLVLIIAGGIAARRGVIIKSASATERAWSVTDVVFDKTGTLTTDDLEVTNVEFYASDREQAFAIALALTSTNDHPVSRSIRAYLKGKDLPKLPIDSVKTIPGKGVQATFNQDVIRGGNPDWLGISSHPHIGYLSGRNATHFAITLNDTVLIFFTLTSTLRPEASRIMTELHNRNITTHLLSGDAEMPVKSTALTLSIPHWHSRQTPQDKSDYIAQLSSQKRRVLFIGDGTNDAAAIARADVGVALGSSSDVTTSSADVLIGNLEGILFLLDLSQAAYRRIVFNFAWSALYNVGALMAAAGVFVRFRIAPAWAGCGELVSILPVVLVAVTMWLVKGRSG